MNTITTVAAVARIIPTQSRVPYEVFVVGLDRLYLMPFAEDEDIHSRCLAIDSYIDGNGWTWDAIIEEMAKPDVNIN